MELGKPYLVIEIARARSLAPILDKRFFFRVARLVFLKGPRREKSKLKGVKREEGGGSRRKKSLGKMTTSVSNM